MNIPPSFIWIIVFFNRAFECGDGGIFKFLRQMQNLHQLMWNRESLYADRYSKGAQL
jgi:hypothetical protein